MLLRRWDDYMILLTSVAYRAVLLIKKIFIIFKFAIIPNTVRTATITITTLLLLLLLSSIWRLVLFLPYSRLRSAAAPAALVYINYYWMYYTGNGVIQGTWCKYIRIRRGPDTTTKEAKTMYIEMLWWRVQIWRLAFSWPYFCKTHPTTGLGNIRGTIYIQEIEKQILYIVNGSTQDHSTRNATNGNPRG